MEMNSNEDMGILITFTPRICEIPCTEFCLLFYVGWVSAYILLPCSIIGDLKLKRCLRYSIKAGEFHS